MSEFKKKKKKPCDDARFLYGHITAVIPANDLHQIEMKVEGDCPLCGRQIVFEQLEERQMPTASER